MSRAANPVAVGTFVLGSLLLAIALILFFSGNNFFSRSERYVLFYDTSIKGLNVGAPVTIKGVKIGQVVDIKARVFSETSDVLNAVTLEIQPDALEREDDNRAIPLEELISKGLSAQLRLQSLLTGLLYVDVDFRPEKLGQLHKVANDYPQIPTVPTDLEQLTRDLESIDVNQLGQDLQQIVGGISKLVTDPAIQDLGKNLGETVIEVRETVAQLRAQSARLEQRLTPLATNADTTLVTLNQELPRLAERMDAAMTGLQQAAVSLQRASDNTAYLISEDSPLIYRINNAAAGVSDAAAQVRRLADELERQPESLLFGKPQEDL